MILRKSYVHRKPLSEAKGLQKCDWYIQRTVGAKSRELYLLHLPAGCASAENCWGEATASDTLQREVSQGSGAGSPLPQPYLR